MGHNLNLVLCKDIIENDIAKEIVIKSIGHFLDNLVLLEKELGEKIPPKQLDPKTLDFNNTSDKDQINHIANEIAKFLNLTSKVLVDIDDLPIGTSGTLSTSDSKVIITLNKTTLKTKDMILGVISRKLAHYYLFSNKIQLLHGSILGIESLLEIAAIYLGLGNIILNSHNHKEIKKSHKKNSNFKIKRDYEKPHYLGFVYKTICNMRNISERDYTSELTPQSKAYIDQAMNYTEFFPYLKQNFSHVSNTTKTITEIKNALYSLQIMLSDIEKQKDVEDYESLSTEEIQTFLIKSHKKLFKYHEFVKSFEPDKISNDRLTFLYNMKAYQTLDEILICLDDTYNLAKKYLFRLLNADKKQHSLKNSNKCNIICWNDGSIIPQTTGKPIFLVKCPNCGYEFISSTDSNIHHNELRDFMCIYNEHFINIGLKNREIEDKGLIVPIISFLKSHIFLTIGLIIASIGLIFLMNNHKYSAILTVGLGFVFMLYDFARIIGLDPNIIKNSYNDDDAFYESNEENEDN